jgi:hypothetical protein
MSSEKPPKLPVSVNPDPAAEWKEMQARGEIPPDSERTEIYEYSEADPAVKAVKENITRLAYEAPDVDAEAKIHEQQWGAFAKTHPEKAAAYNIATSDTEKLASLRKKLDIDSPAVSEELTDLEKLTSEILGQDFTYLDIDLPEELRREVFEEALASEYSYVDAKALAERPESIEAIRNKAREIRDLMVSEAHRLEIPITEFSKSTSWVMTELGAHSYRFSKMDDNAKEKAGDPLKSEEIKDKIINSQLGWEAHYAFKNLPEYAQKVATDPKYAGILPALSRTPSEDERLSFVNELRLLGESLRKIETESAPESVENAQDKPEDTSESAAETKGEKDVALKTPDENKDKKGHGEEKKKWSEKTPQERVKTIGKWSAGLGGAAAVAGLGVWANSAILGSLGLGGPAVAVTGLSLASIGAGAAFLGGMVMGDILGWELLKNLWVEGSAWFKKISGGILGGGGGGGGAKKAPAGGGSHGPAAH